MKITDNIIKRFGADKLLHFCIAGWAVSLASLYGIGYMITATLLVIVLSVVKELRLDQKADWYDLTAALVGMVISWITYLVTLMPFWGRLTEDAVF